MKMKRKSYIIAVLLIYYSLLISTSSFALDASKPATGDPGFGIYVILAIVSGLFALGSSAFLIYRRKKEKN